MAYGLRIRSKSGYRIRKHRKYYKGYVDKVFAELKAHGYNPNLMKLYVMGGGAKVVELVSGMSESGIS